MPLSKHPQTRQHAFVPYGVLEVGRHALDIDRDVLFRDSCVYFAGPRLVEERLCRLTSRWVSLVDLQRFAGGQ